MGPVETITTTPVPAVTTAPTTSMAQAATNPYGGTVVSTAEEPDTLNPYGWDLVHDRIVAAIHVGVRRFDATTERYVPWVVKQHPTLANGGLLLYADGTMTVRYELREEAVWADGTPISGDDFAFTYEMNLEHEGEQLRRTR